MAQADTRPPGRRCASSTDSGGGGQRVAEQCLVEATDCGGQSGPQVAEFASVRVIAVRDGLPGEEVFLVLRRSLTDGELKTYLCNAPADIPQVRLVRMSGMRWPIETCFETGKQELGMGDYEVRSWPGWHHHMTLVIMALAFLVRVQKRLKKTLRR